MKLPARTTFFTLLLVGLFLAQNVSAIEPPSVDTVPGGIAILPIKSNTPSPPKAKFNGKPVMVIQHQNQWHAVVGIPLESKTGTKKLSITLADGKTIQQTFQVGAKEYETQHLTITNKRKVNPNAEDMKRIRKETGKITNALAHWNDQLLASALLLDLPVEGRLSSPFGLRRFFNEQPRRPHSGLDIAAPEGTPIKAPANGKVILTGNFFFNGNALFLDHGQGLVTMYAHMHSVDVKEGDEIKRGQQIGTVGMTGRVTGPHLHWGVSLNDARVNPSLFVPALMDSATAKTESQMQSN